MGERVHLSIYNIGLIFMLDISKHNPLTFFLLHVHLLEINIGQAYFIAVKFLDDFIGHFIKFFHLTKFMFPRLYSPFNLYLLLDLLFLLLFLQLLKFFNGLLHIMLERKSIFNFLLHNLFTLFVHLINQLRCFFIDISITLTLSSILLYLG